MLNKEQLERLDSFAKDFSPQELLWISGYFAGLNRVDFNFGSSPKTVSGVGKITITYGTETGNSKKIATLFAARAKQKKISVKLVSLEQYKTADLSKEEYFFSIISTHGDGEPPAAAKSFYDYVLGTNLQFPNLKFSILSLGDSAYPLFCKAGADIDEQLVKLGGKRIAERQDCDVDFEADANRWIEDLLGILTSSGGGAEIAAKTTPTKKTSGKEVYKGKISVNVNLNDTGSNKETHHIEIISETAVPYLPGDSLGIYPVNIDAEVTAVLSKLGIIGSDFIAYKEKQYTFAQLLKSIFNIRQLPARVVTKYATAEGITEPIKSPIDLIDLFELHPPQKTKANWISFIDILEPMVPRLYSIASSNDAHSEEVHICVAKDSFKKNNHKTYGLASYYLSNLPSGTQIEFYIQKNNSFRLPDDEKDIIMVGPGTGIAPFRAFVAERDARGASGKNWLFFGDQHFKSDFLYQTEWQSYLETGALSRLDVAFSRDTKEKVYVQHKMKQQSVAIFDWLERGAYFYICGSKDPMSTDVEHTLLEIIAEQSGKEKTYAAEYLNKLKEQERYLKDVY
jgi:sulfite reductase (NADPH) flavoprotein alpha-component